MTSVDATVERLPPVAVGCTSVAHVLAASAPVPSAAVPDAIVTATGAHLTPSAWVLSAVSAVPSAPTGMRLLAVSYPAMSPFVVFGEAPVPAGPCGPCGPVEPFVPLVPLVPAVPCGPVPPLMAT